MGFFYILFLFSGYIYYYMDWNYPVKDYFKLSPDKRDEYLVELAKFYYNKFVVSDSKEIFDFTTTELIIKFHFEEDRARMNEDYERAEIFYQLTRLFYQIQEEKEF